MASGVGNRNIIESANLAFSEQRVVDRVDLSDIDGAGVVSHLSQNTDLRNRFEADAGVSEGYTIGEHTAMVIDVARRYRESASIRPVVEKFMCWDEFILFLALHDIGKGASNEAEKERVFSSPISRKAAELKSTREWLDAHSETLGISEKTKTCFLALLEMDVVGGFLKGECSESQFFFDIVAVSRSLGVRPVDFCNLMCAFHTVDAASYPGLKQTLFCEAEGELRYNENNEKKLQPCRDRLMAAVEGQERWEAIPDAQDLPKYVLDHLPALRAYIDLVTVHAVEGDKETLDKVCPQVQALFKSLQVISDEGVDLTPDVLRNLSLINFETALKGRYLMRYQVLELYWSMYLLTRMHRLNVEGIDAQFVHGTRSTALAMMESTAQQLLSSGALACSGIIPLSGEQSNIIGNGVNVTGISSTSLEGGERAAAYADEQVHGDSDYEAFVSREEYIINDYLKFWEVYLSDAEGNKHESSFRALCSGLPIFNGHFLARVALAVQRLQTLGETQRLENLLPRLQDYIAKVQAIREKVEWKTQEFFELMPQELNQDSEFSQKLGDKKFSYHDFYYFSHWKTLVDGIEKLDAVLKSESVPENVNLRKVLEKPFPIIFGFKALVSATQGRNEYKVLHALRLGRHINTIFTLNEHFDQVEEMMRDQGLAGRVKVLNMDAYCEMVKTAQSLTGVKNQVLFF